MEEMEVVAQLSPQELQQMNERQLKRRIFVENNQELINEIFKVKHGKGSKYRKSLFAYIMTLPKLTILTELQEYELIGKFGRKPEFDPELWTRNGIAEEHHWFLIELARAFGAFDY